MVVYLLKNKINGKGYVGQTVQPLSYRLSAHFSKSHCYRLWCAIQKYGRSAFEISVLENCDSLEMLNEREKFWIAALKMTDPEQGYNLMTGGDNKRHSETSRKKISNALKGRRMSEKNRQEMSERKKGAGNPQFGRLGEESPLYGLKRSDLTKAKISAGKKGCKAHNKGKKLIDGKFV